MTTKEKAVEYMKKWKANNPKAKLQASVMALIYYHLKIKSKKTIDYLGCSWEEYINYLEKMFTPKMNWENYGVYWEIDHVYPLSKGGSFHYTNIRPLTITENRSKGNKIL